MGCADPFRILVLDDEALILLDLEYAVEEAGCVALTAMDADEAIGLLAGHFVATAILDVTLARGCTCEPVVRELVARGIPYVLHTGDLNRLEDIVRTMGGELVPKPTPAAVVVTRALAQIERRPRES